MNAAWDGGWVVGRRPFPPDLALKLRGMCGVGRLSCICAPPQACALLGSRTARAGFSDAPGNSTTPSTLRCALVCPCTHLPPPPNSSVTWATMPPVVCARPALCPSPTPPRGRCPCLPAWTCVPTRRGPCGWTRGVWRGSTPASSGTPPMSPGPPQTATARPWEPTSTC